MKCLIKYILVWAVILNCSFCFSKCEFNIKNTDHFYSANTYNTHLKISNVCARDINDKREISDIVLNIHKDDKLIVSKKFKNGYWMPTSNKFYLKNPTAIKKGCFSGVKTIALNPDKEYLNSTSGIYINLKTGKLHNIKCPKLTKLSS